MGTMKKPWYKSRTAWVNLAAVVVMAVQWAAGIELITLEAQAGILALVNIALRLITKTEITR